MNIYTANVIFPVRDSLRSQLPKYVENARRVTENAAEAAAGAETCIPKLHQPQFGLVRALSHSEYKPGYFLFYSHFLWSGGVYSSFKHLNKQRLSESIDNLE